MSAPYLRNPLKEFFETWVNCLPLSRQCAELIFQPCLTKVTVTLRGQSSNDNILCQLPCRKTVEDLFMKFCTNIKHHQTTGWSYNVTPFVHSSVHPLTFPVGSIKYIEEYIHVVFSRAIDVTDIGVAVVVVFYVKDF